MIISIFYTNSFFPSSVPNIFLEWRVYLPTAIGFRYPMALFQEENLNAFSYIWSINNLKVNGTKNASGIFAATCISFSMFCLLYVIDVSELFKRKTDREVNIGRGLSTKERGKIVAKKLHM